MRTIPLTKGFSAIVDDDDFEMVSMYKWRILQARKKIYACASVKDGEETIVILMHRLIMGNPDKSVVVDHIINNTLDNRKENLRVCDLSCNAINRPKKANTTSKYFGVRLALAGRKRWEASVVKNGKRVSKRFLTEIEAAEAYNEMARAAHGEFAKINQV